MATLKSVIAQVDELHHNVYSNELKTAWVSAVEGRIQLNIFLVDIKEVRVYNWETDQETELAVKPPHDDLYVLWLRAQIHAAESEWDEYANAMQMYNAAYGDFLRWFAGRYRPANGYAAIGGGSDNPPYYLTAYGLAVKRGYRGTEEEWLASLVGPPGAPFTYDDFTTQQLAALKGEPGKDGEAVMPVSYINPRTSGGYPNYRYHYEIYTPWQSLPEGFLFSVPLVYGLQSGDGWGMSIMGCGWEATADNFDGWNVEAGTYLFSYAEGKVTQIKGAPGLPGDPGKDGLTPYIGDNGNWWIGDEDTGKPSRGEPGENAVASVPTATPEQAGVVKLAPKDKWSDVNLDENSGTAATPRMVFEAYTMIEGRYNAHDLNSTKHTTAEEKARWDAKSDFSGKYADLTGKPTELSAFQNNLGFITKAVADLVNYYTKSETYTKDEVKELVSAIPKFSITVVPILPTEDISETTIYLVPGGEGNDLYTEYIYTGGKWEILGSQRVDLTGYATETWVLGQLEGYLKSSDLQSATDAALAQAKASGEFDGEPGKDGSSGVYVGSGEMPENCNVQIDPNGEPVTMESLVESVVAALPKYNGEAVPV